MTRCGGFSLIEVLVSLAILTLIATTTLPLMRECSAVLADRTRRAGGEKPVDVAELRRFADLFMEKHAPGKNLPDHGELPWPDQADRAPVVFRRVQADAKDADHAWVVFQSGDIAIWRWHATEEPVGEGESRK